MNNLEGKRLLILGGDSLSSDIIKEAKKLGVHTTVIDWHPIEISPAKLLADQHFEISIKDYEAIDKLIKEQKITGVITGFTDSYLEPYAEICRRNNFPCYASAEQFRITLDKDLFKKLCVESNVPTVLQYDVEKILAEKKLPAEKILIKPVDSSGSRGIVLVSDFVNLEAALEESLSYSMKKEVIVERYMDADDVSMCYTIQDGNISFSAICDRYIHKTEKFGSVTSGLIYPSRYISRYIEEVDEKVKKMFERLGLRNGVLFLQAFVDKDSFYFYEMGYRLSGGRHYIFTKEENGISAVKDLIHFALTGEMDPEDIRLKDNANFKHIYSQISVLCKSKKIKEIKGLKEIQRMPQVLDVATRFSEGETVGKEGTTMQIFARIHIKSPNVAEMSSLISDIESKLEVILEDGENIIEDFFKVPSYLYV
ncbi:MAG: ATP-grasp domain-containing protein [Muribaculum sp.]|nr:ATP-grasp domain-containing protein [Muribaculum sp.]